MNKMAVSTTAAAGGAGFNGSPLFTEALDAIVRDPAGMPADETFLGLLESAWPEVPDISLQQAGFANQRHANLLKVLGAEAVAPAYAGTVVAATAFADRARILRDPTPATARAVAGILLYFTTTISPGSLSIKMGVAENLPSVHRTDAIKRVSHDTTWEELQPLLREVVPLGHMAASEWLASGQGDRLRALTTQPPAARRSRKPRLVSWRAQPEKPTARAPYAEADFDLPGHLQLLEGVDLRTTNRRAYAREIAKIPELEPGEVINLAKRMERGAQAAAQLDEAGVRELPRSERRNLQLLKKEGEQAELYLNAANLRLVTAVAAYYGRMLPGMSFEDLIGAGNLGLVKAVKSFDYTQDNKFSTYAVWHIRKLIQQTIGEVVPPVKIPKAVAKHISDYKEIRDGLTQSLGGIPSVRDIAREMDLTPAQVEEFLSLMVPSRSLSQLNEKGSSWIADRIDKTAPALEDQIVEADAHAATQANIDRLFQRVFQDMGERNEKIVRAACGFGQPKQTHEEVAKLYDLAKTRVDQLVHSFRRRVGELARRRNPLV